MQVLLAFIMTEKILLAFDQGWFPSLMVECEAYNPQPYKTSHVVKCTKGSNTASI
jgi:hypothetical protein